MLSPTMCIYHGNCLDGFSAAWAVWLHCGNAIKYVPGVYGEAPPTVYGHDVVILDFSYKQDVMRELAAQAKSITVLDHHKTAEAEIRPLLDEGIVGGVFDMDHSGCALTWFAYHPRRALPRFLAHMEDRDLWRFKLEHTREIFAVAASYKYNFETWSELVGRCDDKTDRGRMIQEGKALLRKHMKDIEELIPQTKRSMRIGGINVPVVNLPYTMASDAAGIMAEGQPFAAAYFDRNDGSRVFSLRSRGSDGMDVSEIAASYGGGGHKNAAGFQRPLGWEGDPS